MARTPSLTWTFKPGMRAGAFGWRGSANAVARLKSASTEVRVVTRTDPATAAACVNRNCRTDLACL